MHLYCPSTALLFSSDLRAVACTCIPSCHRDLSAVFIQSLYSHSHPQFSSTFFFASVVAWFLLHLIIFLFTTVMMKLFPQDFVQLDLLSVQFHINNNVLCSVAVQCILFCDSTQLRCLHLMFLSCCRFYCVALCCL